ncbi:PHP domain-containing protein [Haloarchaeobius sp. TZWWS8]|uniref:PHP domain-containing protein n=1 Tax=Haloarchaeobius sp. TZWWS8 TaxID=3446121 RepID=UPI003EBBC8EE
MFTLDLHTHTRFFHGQQRLGHAFDPVGVRLLAQVARHRGLDALALTNHDYYTPFSNHDPVLLPGIEISTTAGHVLVIGEDPPRETVPGELTPVKAVEIAHERDCVAVMAHPFRNGSIRHSNADFDAVEVNGKHPENRGRIERLARERSIPVVGGSDAHFPFEVGRAYTVVDAEERTAQAVVEAIRDGRVRPETEVGPMHRALGRLYTLIHDWKGQLEPPTRER